MPPSLYWPEPLLANNWENLTDALNEQGDLPQSSKGTINFTRSTLRTDVTSLDYFPADLRALSLEGHYYSIYATPNNETTKPAIPSFGNLVVASDLLAKVIEAAIMSDLGQTSWDVHNILTSSALLKTFFSKHPSDYSFSCRG
ncbi:hypothetical protein F5X97DRAFT_323735 [Nemania serpens]|nr:hypothetical protein F5X97DRAFT_323735 [Nemania serpens]